MQFRDEREQQSTIGVNDPELAQIVGGLEPDTPTGLHPLIVSWIWGIWVLKMIFILQT
jgi:hypothetical protein